ncbi:MAG: right-handed parallel beta-helix repeat-containing protein [Candidatus Bathyarchaeia archaeon]
MVHTGKADSKTIMVPDDYPTIAEAVDNAADGDLVFVKSGVYHESMLVVNKSISLIGEEANNTIVYFNPPVLNVTVFSVPFQMTDNSIKVNADNVTLTNFTFYCPDAISSIAGLGGIASFTGNKIELVNNSFSTGLNLAVSCSTIADNIIQGGKFTLIGSNNTLRENTIIASQSPSVSVEGSYNIIVGNNATGSTSFYVEGYSNIVFKNTLNFVDGLDLDGTECIIAKNNLTSLIVLGSNNTVYGNKVTQGLTIWCSNSVFYANNFSLVYPIVWRNSVNNQFYHNNFDCDITFREDQDLVSYYWDNGKEGNYWQSYIGPDYNGDGIGDVPFHVNNNITDRYPLMTPFNVSTVTTELPDWASNILSQMDSSVLPSQKTSTTSPFGIVDEEPPFSITALAASIIIVAMIGVVCISVVKFGKIRHLLAPNS